MAYVLGFFAADGSMTKNKRGAHFIEFQINDFDLLENIREALGSNHKITSRNRIDKTWNTNYRLQIGSKIIFNDLLKLGMTPNKSKTIKLPEIPEKYFRHFIRGYFDGDGCVNICTYKRKGTNSLRTIISSSFVSGSAKLLQQIEDKLSELGITNGGTSYYHQGYRLSFSIRDSRNLYQFMYKGIDKNSLHLPRKKVIFEKYFRTI